MIWSISTSESGSNVELNAGVVINAVVIVVAVIGFLCVVGGRMWNDVMNNSGQEENNSLLLVIYNRWNAYSRTKLETHTVWRYREWEMSEWKGEWLLSRNWWQSAPFTSNKDQ
jgi:hypothetical protein